MKISEATIYKTYT